MISTDARWLQQARSHLRAADPVLPGDLALRKAVRAAYRLDHLPAEQEVLAIADKWRPYRSLATSYLFAAAFEPADAPADTPLHERLTTTATQVTKGRPR
jgi:hypothetical protein